MGTFPYLFMYKGKKVVKRGYRYCPKCGEKLVKNGKECGKQRWRCRNCKTARILKREDVRQNNLSRSTNSYLIETTKASSVAKQLRKSRTTFWRDRSSTPPTPFMPSFSPDTPSYYVLDAKGTRPGVVAIVRDKNKVKGRRYGEREDGRLWRSTIYGLPRPKAVVTDGQKGILAVLSATWPGIIIQRCIVHVERNITTKITLHPETKAGQDLRWLIDKIWMIETRECMEQWVTIFNSMYAHHKQFLNRRTYSDNPFSSKKWWFTHNDTRSAYRQIADLLDTGQLFAYIEHPELNLPRTTNHLEGGINARIDELLHAHRGLQLEHKMKIIDAYLKSRS